jgi:hypothetical protein
MPKAGLEYIKIGRSTTISLHDTNEKYYFLSIQSPKLTLAFRSSVTKDNDSKNNAH